MRTKPTNFSCLFDFEYKKKKNENGERNIVLFAWYTYI